MSDAFNRVKSHLLEMGLPIVREDTEEQLVVVSDEDRAISELIVDCEDRVLVLEQLIFDLPQDAGADALRRLLQINRSLVHGAFVLDDEGRLLFRDTLQLENLDANELAASIEALSLGLVEFGPELLAIAGRA
jgi:hypothetical protein